MRIDLDWTTLKQRVSDKSLELQYETVGKFYKIFVRENGTEYATDIFIESPAPVGSDQEDFENNFKANANKAIEPKDADKKVFIRSESRPLGFVTVFTMVGDDIAGSKIGEGKVMKWDFSNADDEITAPTGFKRKRMELQFLDPVHVKEGTFYFKDAVAGSYVDFYVVCPDGEVYLDNNGAPQTAVGDTPIVHYVVRHHILGTVLMGDELNTEAASDEIPSNYKFWLEVTVPDTDVSSIGHASVELYRKRTVIL